MPPAFSAAADGQFVAVAWGGTLPSGATDVFAAVSRDGGRAFAPPVRVNQIDGARDAVVIAHVKRDR